MMVTINLNHYLKVRKARELAGLPVGRIHYHYQNSDEVVISFFYKRNYEQRKIYKRALASI